MDIIEYTSHEVDDKKRGAGGIPSAVPRPTQLTQGQICEILKGGYMTYDTGSRVYVDVSGEWGGGCIQGAHLFQWYKLCPITAGDKANGFIEKLKAEG